MADLLTLRILLQDDTKQLEKGGEWLIHPLIHISQPKKQLFHPRTWANAQPGEESNSCLLLSALPAQPEAPLLCTYSKKKVAESGVRTHAASRQERFSGRTQEHGKNLKLPE
jgi:hypothetical protein